MAVASLYFSGNVDWASHCQKVATEQSVYIVLLGEKQSHLAEDRFRLFCDALRNSEICTKIKFWECKLDKSLFQPLADSLINKVVPLKKLEFYDCELNENVGNILANTLSRLTSLEALWFWKTTLSNQLLQSVATGISSMRKLHTLWLYHCGLTEHNVHLLVPFLTSTTTLTSLDLRENKMGSAGLKLISGNLIKLTNLQDIYLRACELDDESVYDICRLMDELPTLQMINLEFNDFQTKNSLDLLTASVSRNSNHLKSVDLSSNKWNKELVESTIASLIGRPEHKIISFDNQEEFITKIMQSGVKVPYNRSKLLVLGNGAAGKTTTVKSLLGEPFDPEYNSTLVADNKFVSIAPKSVQGWKQKETPLYLEEVATASRDVLAIEFRGGNKARSVNATEKFEKPVIDIRVTEKIYKKLGEEKPITEQSNSQDIIVSIWDFGGQDVFNTVQQLFLTPSGIYFIVFNLEAMLNDPESELEVIKFWLQSLSLVTNKAPCFLIATHFDYIHTTEQKERQSRLREVEQKLRKLIETLKVTFVVENITRDENELLHFFPVDNTLGGENNSSIGKIKMKVDSILHGKSKKFDTSYLKTPVSVAWRYLMDDLFQQNKPRLTIAEITQRAEELGFTDNLQTFLGFYHELGCIVYFNTKKNDSAMSSIVVFTPQWLLDAISCFVYDPKIHKNYLRGISEADAISDVIEYQKTALIAKDTLRSCLWEKYDHQEKDYLLDLGEHLLLLSRYIYSIPDRHNNMNQAVDAEYYLVPAMLTNERIIKVPEKSFLFHLYFKKGMPNGLFERILCIFIRKSSELNGSEPPDLSHRAARICFENGANFIVLRDDIRNRVTIVVTIEDRNFVADLLKFCNDEVLTILKADVFGARLDCTVLLTPETDNKETDVEYEAVKSAMLRGDKFVKPVQTANLVLSLERIQVSHFEVFVKPDHVSRENSDVVESVNKVNTQKTWKLLKLFSTQTSIFLNKRHKGKPKKSNKIHLPQKYDCFLAHEWGSADSDFATHRKVGSIGSALRELGLTVWFDENNLKHIVDYDIWRGLKQSKVVVVFVTQRYQERLTRPDTNAYKEFTSATKRGVQLLIPVVLEPEMLDQSRWQGALDYHIGENLFIDMTTDEDKHKNMKGLAERIKGLCDLERETGDA